MGLEDFIRTNTTDAGGSLTEDDLIATFDQMQKDVGYRSACAIVSNNFIERGRGDAKRAENDAEAAKMEVYRLRLGWRRHFRFRARRRAAERYLDARTMADMLRATFGR